MDTGRAINAFTLCYMRIILSLRMYVSGMYMSHSVFSYGCPCEQKKFTCQLSTFEVYFHNVAARVFFFKTCQIVYWREDKIYKTLNLRFQPEGTNIRKITLFTLYLLRFVQKGHTMRKKPQNGCKCNNFNKQTMNRAPYPLARIACEIISLN